MWPNLGRHCLKTGRIRVQSGPTSMRAGFRSKTPCPVFGRKWQFGHRLWPNSAVLRRILSGFDRSQLAFDQLWVGFGQVFTISAEFIRPNSAEIAPHPGAFDRSWSKFGPARLAFAQLWAISAAIGPSSLNTGGSTNSGRFRPTFARSVPNFDIGGRLIVFGGL